MGDAPVELRERLAEYVSEAVDLLAELQRGSRQCQACGEVLVRKLHESPTAFARRRACDQTCGGRLRMAALAAKRAAKVQATKPCEHCGKEFGPSATTAPGAFKRQRYCSVSCGNRASWATGGRAPRVAKPKATASDSAEANARARASARPLAKSPPARREPRPLPDPRLPRTGVVVGPAALIEGTAVVNGRMYDPSVCELHGAQRGWFGCPACNLSANRRSAERRRPMTPHPDGGR